MPRKAIIGICVILGVAFLTYSVSGAVGAAIMGRSEWNDWRETNVLLFFIIWLGVVVVIALPTLWFLGRRIDASLTQQEKDAAAAAGVGRIAGQALKGSVSATDKLFDLASDPSLPVRCQAVRALALLDKREVDKELLRQVRYWEANDKTALIRTLRSTQDVRVHRVVDMLARDRNPIVAKQAREALTVVTPQTSRMDTVAASVKATRPQGQVSVGMSKQSVGIRRVAGARPTAESPESAAERTAKMKRMPPPLPSMAPGDRAARAAAREEAGRRKAAARAAAAADDQVPMRKRSADIAPKPASGAPRSASAGPAVRAQRTAGAGPTGRARSTAGAAKAESPAGSGGPKRPPSAERAADAKRPPGAKRPATGEERPAARRVPGPAGAAKRRPADAAKRPVRAKRPPGGAEAAKQPPTEPASQTVAPPDEASPSSVASGEEA